MNQIKYIFFWLLLLSLCAVPMMAQSDVEITDSVSSDWGDYVGGGFTPNTPTDAVTELTLSHTTLTMEGGDRVRLTARANISAADKRVEWSSQDSKVVRVLSNGTIIGLKRGTTQVVVTSVSNPSITASCTVNVTSDFEAPASSWVLPWGKDEAWDMQYLYFEQSSYKEPTKGSNGKNWKQVGYDDTSWSTLTGPMGSSGIAYAPYNYVWKGTNNCFCLRRTFVLPAVGLGNYTFHIIHDDGIVAYLNGEQIAQYDDWTQEQTMSYEIPNELLITGENVLAIYIKQGEGGAYLDYGIYYESLEPVMDLALSLTEVSIEGGETIKLEATVNSSAKDPSIVWSVEDPDIAKVTESGIVRGKKTGTTVVTATSVSNPEISANCIINVLSDDKSLYSEYILPWGKESAWTMKYRYFEQADYVEPPVDSNGKSWKEVGYDDDVWDTLTGPMGSEGIWYAPFNYVWYGEMNCFCLRRTFELPMLGAGVYTFKMQHDDDIKVYLNGKLVIDEPDWTDEHISTYEIPNDAFVIGENVLAIYIKQNWGGAYLDYALYYAALPSESGDIGLLPDVPFEFFYQASDYDETTQSIPNHNAATLAENNLQLSATIPTIDDDCLIITERCEGYIDRWNKESTESGAYFYRSGQNDMTIVCKVKPEWGTGKSMDFISNRAGGYNYMLRIGEANSIFLHTGTSYDASRALQLPNSDKPLLLAVRVNGSDDYIKIDNLTTGETLNVSGINWGGGDNVMKFFYNDGGEFWLGDFYWMYYSFECLSDEDLKHFLIMDEENLLDGDVNFDGTVSVVDVTMITNEILKKENVGFIKPLADMNGDGRISIVDATMITNIILGE